MFWPWRTAVAVQERIAANSSAPDRVRRQPETLIRSFGILIVCSAGLLSQGIVGPVVNPLVVIPPIDQAGEQGVVFAFQLRGAG